MGNNKNKASLKVFLLSAAYYALCFFMFIFLVNNVVIEYFTEGSIDVSRQGLTYLAVVSSIVGVATGCRVWLFAKLDERKAKKSPPSEPKS